jgi:hypothetical protein
VAVSEEPTVDPTAPARRERIPHELPHGMSVEGLGLRSSALWLGRMPPAAAPALSHGLDRLSLHDLAAPATAFMMEGEPHLLPAPPRATRRRARVLPARLTFRKGRKVVVEIALAEALDWYARDARVIWKDGSHRSATIAEGTTRPGRVEAGQVIRLALLLDEEPPADAPIRIELRSLGREVHLTLHG